MAEKQLNANFIISAEKLSQCPDFPFAEFPLLGRSNVGKSSFINALANNKKIAKTSNTPGKTRLINFFNFSDKFMVNKLIAIGYDGSAGGGPVYAMGQPVKCGVRPAFRIPASTPIIRDEVDNGEERYIINLPST